MTLRWLEGGDGTAVAGVLRRTYQTINSHSSETAQLGAAGSGWRGVGRSLASDRMVQRTPALVSTPSDEWIVGWAFKVGGTTLGLAASPSEHPHVALYKGSDQQLRVEFIAFNGLGPIAVNYKLRLMRGATQIAVSDQAWSAIGTASSANSQWVFFEMKAVIDPTTGSVEIKYHDRYAKNQTVTWSASVSGINTANEGSANADRVQVSWNTGTSFRVVIFDDIYVCDALGSINNDYLGEIVIEKLSITGTGDTNEWTLAGGAVSLMDAWEEGAAIFSSAEDDERVTSQDVGEISLAALSNPAGIRNVTILGIQTRIYASMDTSGTRDISVVYRKTTGTPAQTAPDTYTVAGTAVAGFASTRELDPNTSAAWVMADIDGLQVGAELTA